MLDLLFDNDFYMSGGRSSDEECNGGLSYLGNDKLYTQDLNALDRPVTSLKKLAVTEAAVMNVKMMK